MPLISTVLLLSAASQPRLNSTNGSSAADVPTGTLPKKLPDKATDDLPMSRFVDSPATDSDASSHAHQSFTSESGTLSEQLLDELRYSVVRIQAVAAEVDWFKPWEPPSDSEGVGTGFVIESPHGIVVITNAHVVRNAGVVKVQLPALGQVSFDADVPLICSEFDVAVVRLRNASKLRTALSEQNRTLRTLAIRSEAVDVGTEVAAFGFPLGSESPKLSRGVIAGVEEVEGAMCYQTTAPISPGNSGGPLLAYGSKNELEVVGVTFASASSGAAQNNNYVVPAIRIKQVLFELSNSTPSSASDPQSTQSHHRQLLMAPLGAVTVEADEALYKGSSGCDHGVFLSSLDPLSLFHQAEPPISAHSFLVAVGDTKLDAFGMGRTEEFRGQPIPYSGLLGLGDSFYSPVQLSVCKAGKVTKHSVSRTWRDSYLGGIHLVDEPIHAPQSMDFEVFAGVAFMQMNLNHIQELLTAMKGASTMGRWLLPELQVRPRLLITHVDAGEYASHVLSAGMVIATLNGKNISTLAEYRDNFVPHTKEWQLETDRGLVFTVDFQEELVKQVDSAQKVVSKSYLLTKAIKAANQPSSHKEESGSKKDSASKRRRTSSESSDDSDTSLAEASIMSTPRRLLKRVSSSPKRSALLVEEAVQTAAEATQLAVAAAQKAEAAKAAAARASAEGDGLTVAVHAPEPQSVQVAPAVLSQAFAEGDGLTVAVHAPEPQSVQVAPAVVAQASAEGDGLTVSVHASEPQSIQVAPAVLAWPLRNLSQHVVVAAPKKEAPQAAEEAGAAFLALPMHNLR